MSQKKSFIIFLLILLVSFNSSYAQEEQEIEKNKNVIAFHITDILYLDLLVSYEHKFPEKEYGLYFPLAYNFGKGQNIYGLNSNYYTGFGLNYYFSDDTPLHFFMGPELNLGSASLEYFDFTETTGSLVINSYYEDYFYSRVFYNGGFRYSPQKNTSILVKVGLGVQYADYPNAPYLFKTTEGKLVKDYKYYQEKRISGVFNFSFGLGISF